MNETPIRLGPLALLLTVISICLTTLAILSFSTARADLSLAERFADTVHTKYALEKEGSAYLSGLEEDGAVEKQFEKDGYTLDIKGTRVNGENRMTQWRITKNWEEDETIEGLWPGM